MQAQDRLRLCHVSQDRCLQTGIGIEQVSLAGGNTGKVSGCAAQGRCSRLVQGGTGTDPMSLASVNTSHMSLPAACPRQLSWGYRSC